MHIGDSRAYLLRDGELSQITQDDTFVQSLVDEGRITEEEAHTHPQRSLLLRALNGQDVEPSLTDARGPPRRPLPALLRRPVRRGQRRDAGRDAEPPTATRASAPTG